MLQATRRPPRRPLANLQTPSNTCNNTATSIATPPFAQRSLQPAMGPCTLCAIVARILCLCAPNARRQPYNQHVPKRPTKPDPEPTNLDEKPQARYKSVCADLAKTLPGPATYPKRSQTQSNQSNNAWGVTDLRTRQTPIRTCRQELSEMKPSET